MTEVLNSRVKILENIQRYLLPLEYFDFARLSLQEDYAQQIVPTIGAEIEIPWSARFPEYSKILFASGSFSNMTEDERSRFSTLCDELDMRYLPMYEVVTRLGVPRDKNQKFWEFAHSPVRHYETLATEMKILERGGLLPECFNLPLHVTIGGLRSGSGGYFVQMMAEIMGGSNEKRIREPIGDMPIYDRKWARKAPNGLKERKNSELRGRSCGFEMRTLVYNSFNETQRTLKVCQLFSLALAQKREYIAGNTYNSDLVDAWQEVVSCVKLAELADVQVSREWQGPADDPRIWENYAKLLAVNGEYDDLRNEMVARGDSIISMIANIATTNSILHITDDKV